MKNEAGIWLRSSRRRMRPSPVCAPKSAADSVVGDVSPRASKNDSLSTSKLRQTATLASFGHDFGVSFLPTRAGATAVRKCSSLQRIPGCASVGCDCANALTRPIQYAAKTKIATAQSLWTNKREHIARNLPPYILARRSRDELYTRFTSA